MTAGDDNKVLHEVGLLLESQSRDRIALAALRVFDQMVALPATDQDRAGLQDQLLRLRPDELRDWQWSDRTQVSRVVGAVMAEARTPKPSREGIDRRLAIRRVQGKPHPDPEKFTLAEFEASAQLMGSQPPGEDLAALVEGHRLVRDVVRLTSPTGGGLDHALQSDPEERDSLSYEPKRKPVTPRKLLDRVVHVDVKATEAAVRSKAALRAAGPHKQVRLALDPEPAAGPATAVTAVTPPEQDGQSVGRGH